MNCFDDEITINHIICEGITLSPDDCCDDDDCDNYHCDDGCCYGEDE
jgi:hypothetical protein